VQARLGVIQRRPQGQLPGFLSDLPLGSGTEDEVNSQGVGNVNPFVEPPSETGQKRLGVIAQVVVARRSVRQHNKPVQNPVSQLSFSVSW